MHPQLWLGLFLMSPPSLPALQHLHRLGRAISKFEDQLSDLLYGEEYQKCVPNVQGDDLVWLVDCLDKVRRRAVVHRSPPKPIP